MKKAFQKNFLKKLFEKKERSLKDYINTHLSQMHKESNGTQETSKKPEEVGETKMENKVR
jgi:hypothetical protein